MADANRLGRRWLVGVGGIALLGGILILIAGRPLDRNASVANAEELLGQAQSAQSALSSGERSYHTIRVSYSPGNRLAEYQLTEMWFRDTDTFRMETYAFDPAIDTRGRLIYGIVRRGESYWTFVEDGPAFGQFSRSTHVTRGLAADKPFSQKDWGLKLSLDEALTDVQACSSAHLIREETVAGRPAYVIAVMALSGCDAPARTIWVDKEASLAVRVETRDTAGSLQSASTVLQLTLDAAIPDARFSYAPPPDAVIQGD